MGIETVIATLTAIAFVFGMFDEVHPSSPLIVRIILGALTAVYWLAFAVVLVLIAELFKCIS